MPVSGLLPSWTRRLLLFVFFLSGASGLIYEIAWMRRLTHVFGSTTLAVSTVLAAFMGGLALGSIWIGRLADRRAERALVLYARLEALIALLALLVPLLLRAASAIYLALYPALEGSPQVFFLVQFLLVALVLVPPTALMGGTLPLLARFSIARVDEVGGRVGTLYAANTIGAAAGAAMAAYALLPGLGVFRSEVFAACLNLAAAAMAWGLARKSARTETHRVLAPTGEPADAEGAGAQQDLKAARPPRSTGLRPKIAVLLLATALSGFAAMVYEVAWSRILAMVLGSSVYAFGMMVLVFLVGISLGSRAFVRMRKRPGRAAAILAAVLTGNTVAGLFAIALVPRLPLLFLIGFPVARTSFLLVQVLQFLVASVLLLPSAFFFGMAFPAAVAATAESVEDVGWTVGRVNAANTGGTVIGAFCGGFALIPHFGLRATLMTAATATAVAALAVLWLAGAASRIAVGGKGWRRSLSLLGGAALVVAALLPQWPREVLAGGAGFYAASYATPQDFLASAKKMEILFYKDGINTTLSVDRYEGYRYYRSNGKTDASTNPHDFAVQVLLGQIPMLLHPQPRDVFDLGLGTGASAAAVARYPVRSIEIVDIEPAGREAARFFEPENRRVLSDPRVHFLAGDGRNVLLARNKSYDVIICDPSDIWVAGVANLFTREFYELARSRLNPGGVFVQWWHTHALDPDHMKLVVATFRRVFPEASYWRPSAGDVIMVGSVTPLPWDYRRLQERVTSTPGVADDLRGLGLWSPLSLFSAFVLAGEDLKNFVAGVREDHVDDRPVVEYAAPRFLYVNTVAQNEAAVTGFQTNTFPHIVGFDAARDLDAHGIYLLGFGYASLERRGKAIQLMEESIRRNPRNAKYLIGLGNQYRGQGQDARAIGAYRRALAVEPGEPEASVVLAAMLRAQGDDAGAEQLLKTAIQKSPQDAGAAMAAGRLLLDTGRAAEAVAFLSGAASRNQQHPGLRLMLGQALAAGGRAAEAVNQLRAAVSLGSNDAALMRAAGRALLAAGDLEEAATACRKSDALEPGNPETLQVLAEIMQRRQASFGRGIPSVR
jgi:spermidine synthase